MPSSACKKSALDRKSTRLNSSHTIISYAVFCLKKKEITFELQPHVYLLARVACAAEPPLLLADDRSEPLRRAGRAYVLLAGPLLVFFFNDRAPPEIHPLSLPAAFPF